MQGLAHRTDTEWVSIDAYPVNGNRPRLKGVALACPVKRSLRDTLDTVAIPAEAAFERRRRCVSARDRPQSGQLNVAGPFKARIMAAKDIPSRPATDESRVAGRDAPIGFRANPALKGRATIIPAAAAAKAESFVYLDRHMKQELLNPGGNHTLKCCAGAECKWP